MAFSILYPDEQPPPPLEDTRFAVDLNLDQVFTAAVTGREKLDLLPLFYQPLSCLHQVAHRHDVLADFERPAVLSAVGQFGLGMRRLREILASARSLHNRWQRERVLLDAIIAYCQTVTTFSDSLRDETPQSRALSSFQAYLSEYTSSSAFGRLWSGARSLVEVLGRIRYAIHVRGARITVSAYRAEADYAKEVEEDFAKFRQGAAADYRVPLRLPLDMNPVDAQVLELVARLNPGAFGDVHNYCEEHKDFIEPTIAAFDRESQFYLAYLEYIQPMRTAVALLLSTALPSPRAGPPQGFVRHRISC